MRRIYLIALLLMVRIFVSAQFAKPVTFSDSVSFNLNARIGTTPTPGFVWTCGNTSGGGYWQPGAGTTSWSLTGNNGTNSFTNYIGTNDTAPFVIRARDTNYVKIYPSNKVCGASGFISMGYDVNHTVSPTPGAGTILHLIGGLDIFDGTQGAGKVFTSDANGNGSWNNATWVDSAGFLFPRNGTDYVGIGTNTPAVKLDIENGSTSPAFKLIDGTQAAGNVLTSDASGNASWQPVTNTAWGLTGNAGTNPSTNFIGTTDFAQMKLLSGADASKMLIAGDSIFTPDGIHYVNGIGFKDGHNMFSGIIDASPFGGSYSSYLLGNVQAGYNLLIDSTKFNISAPGGGNYSFTGNGINYGNYTQSNATGSDGQVLTINSNIATWQTFNGGWSLTGNAGTTAGTNFIGTTDVQPLFFKTSDSLSGQIGGDNTSFGLLSMPYIAGAGANDGFGQQALYNLISGGQNTAMGDISLLSLTNGTGNTAVGYGALANGVINGTQNTAIGAGADILNDSISEAVCLGANAFAGESNAIVFDTLERVYMGLGTAFPKAMLDIEKGTAQAGEVGFKLHDGSQGAGNVLTSDASGNATWQPLPYQAKLTNYEITATDSANQYFTVPVAWTTAFADTNYAISISVQDFTGTPPGQNLWPGDIHNKTASGFDAVFYIYGTLICPDCGVGGGAGVVVNSSGFKTN